MSLRENTGIKTLTWQWLIRVQSPATHRALEHRGMVLFPSIERGVSPEHRDKSSPSTEHAGMISLILHQAGFDTSSKRQGHQLPSKTTWDSGQCRFVGVSVPFPPFYIFLSLLHHFLSLFLYLSHPYLLPPLPLSFSLP